VKIVVYGPGCPRCEQTLTAIRNVLAELGVAAEVEKVSSLAAIAAAGVLATPAVTVDGELKSAGRVPRADEIRVWLA
jgi:small redox-active disulfide protein 2